MGWLSHWHLQTGVLGNDGKNRDVSKRGLYCHSLGCWHRKRLCIHTANTLVCAPGRSASRPDELAKRAMSNSLPTQPGVWLLTALHNLWLRTGWQQASGPAAL